VTDTGIGITPDLLPRIFDLFIQGERSLDRSQGGLGVGLTLVRRLVELHGGRVAVHSAGRGAGSEFVVRLPRIASPRAAGPPAAAIRPPATARRVLVVEDNADAREMLRIVLEMAGHQVHEAPDGQAACEAAAQVGPEVVLVDIGLPGLDGYEVARRLRAGRCPARLIALTGYGQPEDRRRSVEAGFDAHLLKPVDPDLLLRLVAE
jgi:CheY-like chemotaxis protein